MSLVNLEAMRPQLLQEVITQTGQDFSGSQLDLLLSEALYLERFRLHRNPPGFFTRSRFKKDSQLWKKIQSGLLESSVQVERKALLDLVLRHYAEEIGGHFDPVVYKLATHTVPFGFNWLFNAASVKRFLPWGMKEDLQSKLHVLGEVAWLKKLSQKGTVLLVPTHQSNLDSVLVGYVIYLMGLPPFAYGAGINLFLNPVLGFFMSRLGSYTVDRQKSNLIYKQLLKNYSARILREGMHSVFFPGGGRARSGAIESKVKLGLLGTALEAELENWKTGKQNPRIFIIPMVTSYHFVLEASSLIEDHLAESGKHRFIMTDDESWHSLKVLGFFWKFFSSQSAVTMRIGKPLDIFGNFVDEEGHSIGQNGAEIDPKRWLTTCGELKSEPKRDQEYVRELGEKIVERFHFENTVLSSHLVAFTLFESLRKKYSDLDLYRFLRITLSQRAILHEKFLLEAETVYQKVRQAHDSGRLYLSEFLLTADTQTWVQEGVSNLGVLHDAKVVSSDGKSVWSDDMNLLFYYRNRLSGYGF